jgi:hypothetical protein
MNYLLTGRSTFDENLVTVKMDSSKRELDVVRPIVSNCLFVLFMLAVSCIYVARKEF